MVQGRWRVPACTHAGCSGRGYLPTMKETGRGEPTHACDMQHWGAVVLAGITTVEYTPAGVAHGTCDLQPP